MTFQEHTYLRRQRLSIHWNIDEMVYGAIGMNPNNGKHAINSHFSQSNAAYPDALPTAVSIIKSNWGNIVYPHPRDFEELYARVASYLDNKTNKMFDVMGIGALTIYDISLNIGCNIYPKVLPERLVYIHYNSVHKSAEILLKKTIKGNTVPLGDFKNIFPNTSAMEIEDILCVYHDEIINNPNFCYTELANMPNNPCCDFENEK